jgi:signal transduction histidine kinase
LLLEANGQITLANEALETITGRSRTEFIGHRLDELPEVARTSLGLSISDLAIPAIDHEPITLPSQKEEKASYVLDSHAPVKHLERSMIPVHGQSFQPSGWVILIRDVTQEVEDLEARELLGETLVHDLRSPISSVISALEMIQDAHASGDPTGLIGPSLQIARRSAKRVLKMIESLLEITRLQSGTLKLDLSEVEIRSLVDSCLAEFASQAREDRVSIENAIARDLPTTRMDRGKVFRVLNNLVDNALKFADDGGTVRITAVISPDRDLQIRVSDSGPGIPEEYRQRIFERFTQIPGQTGRRKGSGLGLTYCRLAVEAHQGRIWVEARPGGGSVFVFTIPTNL